MAESTVSEEEFSWSLAQALKDFSVESLKAEQVECIRRLICLREDVLAVLPTGFGKSLIYQIIPKVCSCLVLKKSKETKSFVVCVVSPLEYIKKQQVESIKKLDCGLRAAAIGERDETDKDIEEGRVNIGQVIHGSLHIDSLICYLLYLVYHYISYVYPCLP